MDALEHESNEDYAFYARCRGLSEKRLLLCHFFPRAAMGLVPNFLQSIGLALANATVIESIFSIPGFGYLIVNHVLDRDTPMIHAEVFFLALAIALCNIAADLVQWAIGRKKGGGVNENEAFSEMVCDFHSNPCDYFLFCRIFICTQRSNEIKLVGEIC